MTLDRKPRPLVERKQAFAERKAARVRFADIAEQSRPLPDARFVLITAYDTDPGSDTPYTTNTAYPWYGDRFSHR